MIEAPISYGELFDKITILELKCRKIKQKNKLVNVSIELQYLIKLRDTIQFDLPVKEITKLKYINTLLWGIEDRIRKKEKTKCFDCEFIKLARSVYKLNDKRSCLKRQINIIMNSTIIEEKTYN